MTKKKSSRKSKAMGRNAMKKTKGGALLKYAKLTANGTAASGTQVSFRKRVDGASPLIQQG